MQGKCITTNKAIPTRTTPFSKEKRAALGGTRTHDTLLTIGRALFLLSYQGSSAGRALSLQHNTRQSQTPILCAMAQIAQKNPHLICRSSMYMYMYVSLSLHQATVLQWRCTSISTVTNSCHSVQRPQSSMCVWVKSGTTSPPLSFCPTRSECYNNSLFLYLFTHTIYELDLILFTAQQHPSYTNSISNSSKCK